MLLSVTYLFYQSIRWTSKVFTLFLHQHMLVYFAMIKRWFHFIRFEICGFCRSLTAHHRSRLQWKFNALIYHFKYSGIWLLVTHHHVSFMKHHKFQNIYQKCPCPTIHILILSVRNPKCLHATILHGVNIAPIPQETLFTLTSAFWKRQHCAAAQSFPTSWMIIQVEVYSQS